MKIEVVCTEEQKVIGVMQLPMKGQKLSADYCWKQYHPSDQKYVLGARPRDGEYLRCPHCHSKTEIVGDGLTYNTRDKVDSDTPNIPPISRDELRAKIVREHEGQIHEHVASDAGVKPQGRPFVLGSITVSG